MRIEFASRAAADLSRIYLEGVERFGPAQAERYSASFAGAFDLLARFPLAGGQLEGIRPPTRHLVHCSHVIFYEVRDDAVLIQRILHGHMLPDDYL